MKNTKVCPKISKHHFELNNLSKMRVKLAVQVSLYIKFKVDLFVCMTDLFTNM